MFFIFSFLKSNHLVEHWLGSLHPQAFGLQCVLNIRLSN